MIWTICAILTAMMLISACKLFFTKKYGSLRIAVVLFFLLLAAYVVYIPPFVSSFDLMSALIGDLINVFQVISLDADYLGFYDVVNSAVQTDALVYIYLILLGVIHALLPVVSALTAVTVLFRCFSSLQLWFADHRKKTIYIFSEFNERSLQLAKSLKTYKSNIVFANYDSEAYAGSYRERTNYIFKEESLSEVKLKHRADKEVYYFCISENEDESLSMALSTINEMSGIDESIQEHTHIFMFSKSKDYSLYIDSTDKGSLDIQCINECEMLTYSLLDKYPLFKYARNNELHVLICGLNEVGVTVLKAVVWCGQLAGYKLKISVVGKNIEDEIDNLKISVPEIFSERYEFKFFDCRSESEVLEKIKLHCSDAGYIVVNGASDNDTMEKGVILRRMFYHVGETFTNCPPIFCYIKDNEKHNVMHELKTAESRADRKMSYSLIPFGALQEIFTYKNLVDSDIEKLAKNVHLAYEEIFSDSDIDVKGAIKRYNVFEVNKRSNRANALHIRYKLNLLGLDYTSDETDENINLSDYLDSVSLEKLALSEHDRWMAFLETEGWIPATLENVKAYRESGISKGRHNCPLLKMHPYMCGYQELKALSTEIEGKDTTIYDAELIKRIPDIIGDKWKIAGKTFKLIKINK